MTARQHRDEHGKVLVITLVMILSLAALGLALNHAVALDIRIAGNYRDSLSTLYVAESGIEHAIAQLNQNPAWRGTMAGNGYAMEVTLDSGTYRVWVWDGHVSRWVDVRVNAENAPSTHESV